MRRRKDITIKGQSGLDVHITIRFNLSGRELTRAEQNRVVNAMTDHVFDAARASIPYHETIHTSDIQVR